MSVSAIMMEDPSATSVPSTAYGTVPRATKHLGVNLQKELEILKERNKEDKRLKEKFPKINGEPTWLLRHIELLQEDYAKNGWEYDIEIPEECRYRIRASIIGSYLIFTRDKKCRKGKVTQEYIPVPLSNGASWGSWKPMDDNARPPTAGRLPYLPAPAPGEAKIGYGLLDHELDAFLTADENEEDLEEYTINGMGVLPEDRPRRRVISNGSSSSGSSGNVSAYSSSSFNTALTSTPSYSIMASTANYAPDRSLRSTRKVSDTSVSSTSTNDSSTSHTSLMSNGMPVPGSIRKPKYGERSDSEGLEDDSDEGQEDDEEDEEDSASTQQPINRQIGRSRIIQDSDSDDDEDEDEFAVKPVNRKKGLLDAVDLSEPDDEDEYPKSKPRHGNKRRSYEAIENSDDENGRVFLAKSAPKPKKVRREIIDIDPYDEVYSNGEAGPDEDEAEDDEGSMAGDIVVEEEYDDIEEFEDDEWFDESGYCKFCDLHQHECECIRDENDLMERGEDDDDYKN